MRITLISRSWPPDERSGVSLSAFNHARLLLKMGHLVSVIGSSKNIHSISLPLTDITFIESKGSGALYSPIRINYELLSNEIANSRPDLVIVEAWQTALTDTAIKASHRLGIPVLMISHGISLHPHQYSIRQLARSFAWLPYRFFKLPYLIKNLSALTTLDTESQSMRFYDRYLAKKVNIPILNLRNFPTHRFNRFIPRDERKKQILVVGYFSEIKNQLSAINVLSKLPEDISCIFIGDRHGKYFDSCRNRVARLGLESRTSFLLDTECDLGYEIARSALVFLPSLTEALPITLIEAMALGTPFVATPVGAINTMMGGLLADNQKNQVNAIKTLLIDSDLWQKYSAQGIKQYESEFTEERIYQQLFEAINVATRKI